jgi:hypothetical protein
MKSKIAAIAVAAVSAAIFSVCVVQDGICAAAPLTSTGEATATINKQDTGAKARIKEIKKSIAEERDGILAAGRKLSEAKRSKDRELIGTVKKEVDAEIADRKARINTLKDELGKLLGGFGDFAPSGKGRYKEAP